MSTTNTTTSTMTMSQLINTPDWYYHIILGKTLMKEFITSYERSKNVIITDKPTIFQNLSWSDAVKSDELKNYLSNSTDVFATLKWFTSSKGQSGITYSDKPRLSQEYSDSLKAAITSTLPAPDTNTSTLPVSNENIRRVAVSDTGTSIVAVSNTSTSTLPASDTGTSIVAVSNTSTSTLPASDTGTTTSSTSSNNTSKLTSYIVPGLVGVALLSMFMVK